MGLLVCEWYKDVKMMMIKYGAWMATVVDSLPED